MSDAAISNNPLSIIPFSSPFGILRKQFPQRRFPMKRSFAVVFLCFVAFSPVSAFAQLKATAQNVPEISYTSVPNFLKAPPGETLGESVGIATNSKGHIFVYFRSANTRLWE